MLDLFYDARNPGYGAHLGASLQGLCFASSLQEKQSHKHLCAGCEKEETGQQKFRVCVLCQRQQLLVKTYYCSLCCFASQWTMHKLVHNALTVSAVNRFGKDWDPRDFLAVAK